MTLNKKKLLIYIIVNINNMSEEKKIPTYNKEDLEDKQERCLICALDSYEDLIVCVCGRKGKDFKIIK